MQTEKIKATFLAYHKEVFIREHDLFKNENLKSIVDISAGSLAKREGINCDIGIAILGRRKEFKMYKHDVAFLKMVRKIPVVIAIIGENLKDLPQIPDDDEIPDNVIDDIQKDQQNVSLMPTIEEGLKDIAADVVFYMPLDQDKFEKTIKTYVAAIKIDQGKVEAGNALNTRGRPLGEILIEADLITPLQLKKALEFQKTSGQRLGDALVDLEYIDESQKTHFLARQLGVPSATPKQFASAQMEDIALIPEDYARANTCMALERDESILTVAMTDVLDLRLLDNLRDITEMTINPVLASAPDIKTAIERYYKDISSQNKATHLLADLDEDVEVIQEKEDDLDIEKVTADGEELGIIKLVNMIISNAIRDRASDIHIEPMENELNVRCRIDGDLRKTMSPPLHSHQPIVARLKILSNLDIAERRLPQDGRMAVKIAGRQVDIRVSVLPSIFGEKVVLRILDKDAFNKNTGNLGFTDTNLRIFEEQIKKPYGMIIVTGPTGSGKSTTLYSALQQIKNITRNIITVEDPVEFHIDNITQVQVNTKIGMTFAAALRSILRQDPDIILIGEIRDGETADIAIKMALTGHLVFSTLHTNDAASSVARFVDIGIPPLLLGSSLNLIMAQRLVRRICEKCKKQYTPDPKVLEEVGLPPNIKLARGEGCVACNGTGFSGRVGIFEMLPISREIRSMIIRNAPTPDIQDMAEKEGMKTLRKAGLEHALKGVTTIEQIIAATTEI